jgi:hypothetical protein
MTESADGPNPEVRGGVPLPKVTSAAASELFSPDPVESSDVAVPPNVVGPAESRTTVMPEASSRSGRSRAKIGIITGAAAALVAVPLLVIAGLGGGDDPHGPSAQDRPSGAANPGVPAPTWPSGVPSPSASPTPGGTSGTHGAQPGTPSKQPGTGTSGDAGSGDGTSGGGTSGSGTTGGGTSGGGGVTSVPAGPPVRGRPGGPLGGGRPGGRGGGGPRGPWMGGGFR